MCLLTLSEDAVELVLCYLDTPQDLLRLGRTCHRLHAVVEHSQQVWQQLYHATYPQACTAPQQSACYKRLFQERWIREARELRLQRRVERMRLQSDVAQLHRELQQLQDCFKAERSLQQSLEQQLREVQRAKLANSQTGQWQLGAIKQYHNRILQSSPVRLEAKLADLQQQQKVSRLQSQTLKARLDLHRQRLFDTKQRLAAHEG